MANRKEHNEYMRGFMGMTFRKIEHEIDSFEARTEQKTFFGWLHAHSRESLLAQLSGEINEKIESIIGTSNDMVEGWLKNGSATNSDIIIYNNSRIKIYDMINNARKKVESRDNTLLDHAREAIVLLWTGVNDVITKVLPEVSERRLPRLLKQFLPFLTGAPVPMLGDDRG